MKKISIIAPIYNEEDSIQIFYERISTVIKSLSNYEFELVFVNDGSADESAKEIQILIDQDKKVRYLEFSRNFGKEAALSAGLHSCSGDAAIMIDVDLQHPPELIPDFIKKWEAGAEIVVGIRKKTQETDLIKRAGSWLFYKIMSQISDTKIAPRATDFRLLDRIVINEFTKLTENNRITRGLIAWLGFKKEFIEFDAAKRAKGTARYSKSKLFHLAITSFITQSLFPLKLAGYLGMIIMLASGLVGLHVLIYQYLLDIKTGLVFSGIAQLAILIIFLVGLILSCLGLMALYIANIQKEVMHRPLYVVRKKINF